MKDGDCDKYKDKPRASGILWTAGKPTLHQTADCPGWAWAAWGGGSSRGIEVYARSQHEATNALLAYYLLLLLLPPLMPPLLIGNMAFSPAHSYHICPILPSA